MRIERIIWIRLVNVSDFLFPCSVTRFFFFFSDDHVIDMRSKFGAIQREHSPIPRKFYAFCTSVTDTATTAGIIASGEW